MGANETDISYKEFNKKSIIWGKTFFLKLSMVSSDGFNHGLSCGNHFEQSEPMRCNWISIRKVNAKNKVSRGKVYSSFGL